MVSADEAGLLGSFGGIPASQSSQGSQGSMGGDNAAKRTCLRRADYVQSQMLQPHAPSQIEQAPLGPLWSLAKAGNKWTEHYTYLAHCDPLRQGVAISQAAQALKHAISHFRQERVKAVLKPDIYEKVRKVVDEIYPHLEKLDGGYNVQGKKQGFHSLGRQATTRTDAEVETAAKALYKWFKKEACPFRGYLQIISGGGIVYVSQVEEKLMRAYFVCGGATEQSFILACKKRLCSDLSARDSAMLSQPQDDAGLWSGGSSGSGGPPVEED